MTLVKCDYPIAFKQIVVDRLDKTPVLLPVHLFISVDYAFTFVRVSMLT